jgi:serine protease Do
LIYYGVKEGFIITKINKKPVLTAAEASNLLDSLLGSGQPVYIEVLNLEGEKERYAFR